MSNITGDFIPQPLRLDHRHVLYDQFVIIEVQAQFRVVLLNQLLSGSLRRLGSDTSLGE